MFRFKVDALEDLTEVQLRRYERIPKIANTITFIALLICVGVVLGFFVTYNFL